MAVLVEVVVLRIVTDPQDVLQLPCSPHRLVAEVVVSVEVNRLVYLVRRYRAVDVERPLRLQHLVVFLLRRHLLHLPPRRHRAVVLAPVVYA